MSHFAFVNPGGPQVPDLAKAKRYGITRLFWQANDVQISAGLFQGIRDNSAWAGVELGIMRDPIWGTLTDVEYDQAVQLGKPVAGLSAHDLARTLDADLVRLGSGNSQCAVLADIEYHDPAYLMAFLHEWRALRPRRVTGWTLEPLQGGWFTKDLAAMILASQVACFPQDYSGGMVAYPADEVRCDLIEAGIPRGMVGLVYKASVIAQHWDGIAFPFHELP